MCSTTRGTPSSSGREGYIYTLYRDVASRLQHAVCEVGPQRAPISAREFNAMDVYAGSLEHLPKARFVTVVGCEDA